MDPIFQGLGQKRSPALPEPPEFIRNCIANLKINPPATEAEIQTFLENLKERKQAYHRNQERMTKKVSRVDMALITSVLRRSRN